VHYTYVGYSETIENPQKSAFIIRRDTREIQCERNS